MIIRLNTTAATLPFGLRVRLIVAKIMAAAGIESHNRRDSERRFMEIARSQSKLVASICLSFANTKEDFDDLRQDSLLNIWRGIGTFREDSSISTWVYRVTLNTCVSFQRKSKGKVSDAEALKEFYRELFEQSSTEDVERFELMYSLIAKLPALDKSVLMMWLDDKSYDEIARVMGLSRDAVASRLKRAKNRLSSMAAKSENTIL